MKHCLVSTRLGLNLISVIFIFNVSISRVIAQNNQDTTYLPKISINSLNGYGPYYINTKRSNEFIVYNLPENTSKVIMKFIDIDDQQIGKSYTTEGLNIEDAIWKLESDTMDFPLSPRFSVEVHYQPDSLAVYNIPYIVYPDTVNFFATAGWGPFITNNYTFTDTSWHDVPEVYNTFSVSNLPPRTDTVKFVIISADSTVLDSSYTVAEKGQFLDSASFANVRMDLLPLSARYLEAYMICNGGPKEGVVFHKELTINPQGPKLFSKVDGFTLQDSLGVFYQNQIAGQSLLVDSMKYAIISNGPGKRMSEEPYNYKGPYSLDIMSEDYTIEAWLKFDLNNFIDNVGEMYIMAVDSVWALSIKHDNQNSLYVSMSSLAGGTKRELFFIWLENVNSLNTNWHHIAFTGSSNSQDYFYFDGELLGSVGNDVTFNHILDSVDYKASWKTKSLYLGGCNSKINQPVSRSFITAMDEVRIWDRRLTTQEIQSNLHKKILQDTSLVGYWNFNDLRNRLNYISDLSFYNNTGQLKKNATFVPQYPDIEKTMDTITIVSSNVNTDSIKLSFVDKNTSILKTFIANTHNGSSQFSVDVSAFPYSLAKLEVNEYYSGCNEKGFSNAYPINEFAPFPIATPVYNWNTFYYSPNDFGRLYNRIIVSGLPESTYEVELGFEKDNQFYDTKTYTENSIPYRYSLSLNGEDNYIETSQNLTAPDQFVISLWFKSTTNKGGKLIGFTDSQSGVTMNNADREIILETDGSLRFYLKGTDSTYILTAANRYDDGEWHYVEASYYGDGIHDASLSVDGAKVDHKYYANAESYSGYWVIGRNSNSGKDKSVAEYFEGLICEVKIESNSNPQVELQYKLDEAKGTTIHDFGNNNDGVLKGGSHRWNHFNSLSFVVWEDNMVNKLPGDYNFYAKVYYTGGPDTGVIYPLGRYILKDPFPENYFAYNLYLGLGSFNEGTKLYNTFGFETDYDQSNQTNWEDNFVKYVFVSPNHQIIDHNVYTFSSGGYEGSLTIDMGDAPPGSYLSIEQGYHTTDNAEHITGTFSIPIYINPMLAPKVTYNPGPFDQAIVPGTMEQENTFIIETEIITDLNKIIGKIYDVSGNEIVSQNAEMISGDTLWHLTFNMAVLPPPVALFKIEYYLGDAEYLALIEGPYKIKIHKTRPEWFDFLPDTAFHDIKEYSDSVSFSVNTTFEENFLINNSETVKIPKWVPLIGETQCTMKSPSIRAYLNYTISDYKLELDQSPDFFQKVFNLGAGTAETFRLGFNYTQDNSYEIDSLNNLIATQNFATGGSVTTGFNKLENVAKKVKELIEAVKVADPETIIVSPTFGLSFTGGFEYASRSRMMIDTVSGKWGSIGNLDVDADTTHHDAYKNSASYRFYSGSLGGEFSIGVELLDGLASANFGFDGRFLLGFGHSFITIPEDKSKHLKSFAFQFYERFYITALWGWYEKNVWGPKLKYNKTIWGDDMTNAFPHMKKKSVEIKSTNNFELTNSLSQIKPVSWFSKMSLANPQQTINLNDDNRIFIWIEPDKSYGGRKLRARHFNLEKGEFSETFTITANRYAIHSPSIDMIDENTAICAWSQTRHTPETIMEEKSENIPRSFVQAQDIWFGVYDLKNDSLIKMGFIEDEVLEFYTGRAEANPELTVLSDSRVLITWQVADLNTHQADIWYAFIEKKNGQWLSSYPTVLVEIDGVETEIKVASPEENVAVIVWKNTLDSDEGMNRLYTSTFTGSYWTVPEKLAFSGNGDYHNYFDMDFENEMGALVFTDYIIDTVNGNFEKLSILPWNPYKKQWSENPPTDLHVDLVNHLQLPRITINEQGMTAIGFKTGRVGSFVETERISQVDLVLGDLSNPTVSWKHIAANSLVCDTTKQVRELDISFSGNDTLLILSHEFVMSAADMPYTPTNGVRFGDPYMNLVLRSISFDEEGYVYDVDENTFFENGNDTIIHHSDVVLGQSFPNPCNTSATVQIYLPVNTNVLLEIFDINGLRVGTVIDQEFEPGQYEVKLNVNLLRQGVYIYKLTTDNSVKSMKMVVGK